MLCSCGGMTEPHPVMRNKQQVTNYEKCPECGRVEKPKDFEAKLRDPIWDSLLQVCGLSPDAMLTKTERGRFNKAVKELKEVGATPDEIRVRTKLYMQTFPGIKFTALGLVANWSTIAAKPKTVTPPYHQMYESPRR